MSSRRAVHLWITDGLFCPNEESLFDPRANCPAPVPPESGQWVGSVEVAFDGNDEHAGIYVARVGGGYTATLIGYRVPSPGWCLSNCPSLRP